MYNGFHHLSVQCIGFHAWILWDGSAWMLRGLFHYFLGSCVVLLYTLWLFKKSKVLPKCKNKYFQLCADKFYQQQINCQKSRINSKSRTKPQGFYLPVQYLTSKRNGLYMLPSFPNYLFPPESLTLIFPILIKRLYQKFPEFQIRMLTQPCFSSTFSSGCYPSGCSFTPLLCHSLRIH